MTLHHGDEQIHQHQIQDQKIHDHKRQRRGVAHLSQKEIPK